MNVLGISDVTGNHSHSCVALLQDGRLTAALSQERISRKKNDPAFPFEAVETVLKQAGLQLADIDAFACAYPVPRYYASLFRHGALDLPRSAAGLLLRQPTAVRYFLPNIKKAILDPKTSNGLYKMGIPHEKFRFVDHHLAHVVAGYFSSGYDEALAVSYGGFAPHADGRNVAGAVYRCRGNQIEHLEDIPLFASGCFWSGITVALGFRYMEQEGKTMGLAAGTDPGNCLDELLPLASQYDGMRWKKYPLWIDYLMSPRRDAFLSTITGRRLLRLIENYSPKQVAAAAQHLLQKSLVAYIESLLKKHPCRRLILSGGLFLNVRLNTLLAALPGVDEVFVHPHPGDGSTAIGAAAEIARAGDPLQLQIADTGWGVEFNERQIEAALLRFDDRLVIQETGDPALYAADRIAAGAIIGWFQGREEYGPRALGHRCILGDPRRVEIRDEITRHKGREAWIPVSPSILSEKAGEYFAESPDCFMMRACRVRDEKRDELPGALHADGTARVQAVDRYAFPPFRRLIERFYARTGLPMVLNSSLNRHGEPIVHRPEEAIRLLLDSVIDELVIGPFVVQKAGAKNIVK
ncbi:MAG: hypothetical protein ONB12_03330 [candidate division KSB1 bacterium]|nr:hypothetical protein [candidate division KSB1 bacterium]